MLHVRRLVIRRRIAIVVVCILVGVLAATAVISAVAATNMSAVPTVRPYIASLPPAKQTLIAPHETKIAEDAAAHPELRNIRPTETLGPPVEGIQNKYPDAWNQKLPIQNEWFGTIGGKGIAIYAGDYASIDPDGDVRLDREQGYVAVGITPVGAKSHADTNYEEYLTPTKHGALKITAVNGTQVSLVAADGTAFTFNLDTRTFS